MRGARLGGIGQRVDGLSPFARGFRLEIARNTHFTRATVIDHIKFEYTGGGGKIGDMLHITFSTLPMAASCPRTNVRIPSLPVSRPRKKMYDIAAKASV